MSHRFAFAAALAAMGLLGSATWAVAQIDADRAVPAEFPPASYTARQYVDSRGCVYVRAGVDGSTQWVPRVARNRQVICGFQPSLQGAEAQTATATPPRNPDVVQIVPTQTTEADEPAATTPAPVVAAPAPAPRAPAPAPQPAPTTTTTTAAPAPTVTPRPAPTVRRVTQAPAPQQRTVRVAPAPAPAPVVRQQAPRVVTTQTTGQTTSRCQGASTISNQYMAQGARVRCGPQTQPFVTFKGPTQKIAQPNGRTRTVNTRSTRVYPSITGNRTLTPQTTVVPRTAYLERLGAPTSVPNGYKPAWDDNRLNPRRAYQTLEGRRVMLLTWSNTVPRQLLDKLTGEEVSAFFPDLRYPFTSMDAQQRFDAQNKTATTSTQSSNSGVVSTRSAAAKAPVQRAQTTTRAKAASHRFVQTGPFHADQAHKVVQRFRGAGLPVQVTEFKRGGKAYRYVLAGPYTQQSQLDRGVARVQRLGYGTKLRK